MSKTLLKAGSLPFWIGTAMSGFWGVGVFTVVAAAGPAHSFAGVPLADWAIGVSAIVSPVALIWMVAAYIQRAADVVSVADPLRRQLAMITGESGAAEARIRRFNQSIREQIDLLKNAQSMSKSDFASIMERVRSQRDDLERFEQGSIQQVNEIQEIVRSNMQQIETLMDDKFTMLRILDERLMQSGDSIARQAESVRTNVSHLLEEVDSRADGIAGSLDRAVRDSKKLADISHTQEESLSAAVASAADTLNGLSGKIDLSVTRFLERAGTAREEAERLAGALDTQTRSLDELSNTLPVRVSEAESVMRGVADRLYASEQLAREQAGHLTEKLSSQVEGLQSFLDRFGTRLTDVDTNLKQRREDLDALASRIDTAAHHFTSSWEGSMSGLNERASDAIARFTAVNDETRKGADHVASHLSETTARYEGSAIRLHRLTEESGERMKEMTSEIATHLTQFESLREASDKAGAEVQERAAGAMQNLHHVLERLLTARESTTAIGETLVRDLHTAVEQNERLIVRLNEAAQMSVHALGVASESLGRQENDSAERTRASCAMLQEAAAQMQSQAQTAERGLRDQAIGLMALLNETRTQMVTTEQNLQGFAARALPPVQDVIRQIDASAEQGLESVSKYGIGLGDQLNNLQQFHARVGSMSDDVTRLTGETLTNIEQINNRFAAAKTAQEDVAQQTLTQFTDLADRLQREVAGLDGQTAKAVETLQQAAAGVGEQSYQLLQTAENSGARMQIVTSALQNESTQIRAILQKQADDLAGDLSRADKQFTMLGEALKQRTDAAYAMLDRIAAHYNESTRAAATDLETRTQRFGAAAGEAQGKAEALSAAIGQHLTLISTGSTQLESQAAQIGNASSKALQQLTGLNEKLTFTHDVANNNARQTVTRLDECTAAFTRQGNALAEASQTAVAQVQKAGATLGEQTVKLQDNAQRIDQNLRQLGATASSVHEQSTQIRNAMEQQNQRLSAQLGETVTALIAAGGKLEQTTATAMLGAEQAGARFRDMSSEAAERLSTASSEMQSIAEKAETSLSGFGVNITQQAASLSVVSEQLGDQYRAMSAANDSQRAQLIDLFDKLGGAHSQASDVAERTIARLSESLAQIQHQLGLLSDQTQTSVGQVRNASTGFADQSAILVQSAQAAEQQARTVLSVTATLQEQARQMHEQIENDGKRTGDVLGSLVSKLAAGSGELRDVGSSAEVSLGSLNNSVMQQSRDLSASMAQLGDRQKTLTTALDAQRDVLNGLLHRLALAQDETASLAERTAARLTEGSTQIGRQIENIGGQAANALASVQAANAGFADEAGTLGLHAQQAEQQMRGVLTVTAGLQEQTRQLRESMQVESARVIEQMNAALGQIDNTTQMLKTQSGSVVQVLDQTVLQFATHARTSSDEMMKQVEVLTTATNQAQERLNDAAGSVRDHVRQVAEIGDRAEIQARQVADTADHATNRLVALRATLEDSDAESQTLLTQAVARIEESRTSLHKEVAELAELARATLNDVTEASKAVSGQSDVLRSNLAMSESALQSAASLVREENAQLPSLLDRSVEKIEAAARTLRDQARDADTSLVGTADRFVGVATAARENVAGEIRRIAATAEQANTLLADFAGALSNQLDAFKTGAATLSNEQAAIVARAGDSVTQLAAASDRLSAMRVDASQTAERLARDFETIDQRSQATSQRLTESSTSVVKTVDALAQASGRAEAQLTGASTQFREHLERMRAGLQTQVEEINRGLMQITAQLERTGTTLRSTTAGTVADVERISQRFDQTSKDAAVQLADKTARMRSSTEEVAKLLSGFGDQLDVLLDRLGMAGDGIRRHEGDLSGQLQAALAQLATVSEKLEAGRALASEVSTQTVAKLGEAADSVRTEINTLTSGSQAAAGIMRGIGQIYTEQTDSLNKGVREAHGQMQTMNKSIDDMQQRTDRMRVSLKLQSDELLGSLQQILGQLAATGDTLTDAVDHTLKSRAEEGLKKII